MLQMRRLFLFAACLSALAKAEAPHGIAVPVMLLKDVSSSGSKVGETVPLVVTRDVEFNGRVIISEGTMAFAKVSQCRGEGPLSAPVFDRPARLSLSLEPIRDIDGNEVKLVANPNKSGDLQMTRAMIPTPSATRSEEISSAWANPSARSAMQKVHALFVDASVSLSEREAEVLILHNVELPAVQQAIRTGVFNQAVNAIRDVIHGRLIDALLTVTPMGRPARLAARTVRELGRLSGGISGYLEGRFKGRNIRCPAGVELTLYAG